MKFLHKFSDNIFALALVLHKQRHWIKITFLQWLPQIGYLFIFQLHLCFRTDVRYLPELWSSQRKRKKKPTAVKTFFQRHSAHVTVRCICCGGLPGEEHEKVMLRSKTGCRNRRGVLLLVHAAKCRMHARREPRQTCKGGLLHLCQTAAGLKQGMLCAKLIPVLSWGGGAGSLFCMHKQAGWAFAWWVTRHGTRRGGCRPGQMEHSAGGAVHVFGREDQYVGGQ